MRQVSFSCNRLSPCRLQSDLAPPLIGQYPCCITSNEHPAAGPAVCVKVECVCVLTQWSDGYRVCFFIWTGGRGARKASRCRPIREQAPLRCVCADMAALFRAIEFRHTDDKVREVRKTGTKHTHCLCVSYSVCVCVCIQIFACSSDVFVLSLKISLHFKLLVSETKQH